jgi:tetratricopeptide (TPR) repeat protein
MSAAEQADRASLAAAVRKHREGRLREAVSAYEALLPRAPNDADLLQLLGAALAQLGREAEAAILLARSVEIEPKRPGVWLNLARALHTLRNESEALRACERALALDASLAPAYRLQGTILTGLGRREEALASAGQAVRLAMNDAAAHADLGVALQAVGREHDALGCFERAIELDPNLAAAHHNRALLLMRRADHQAALQSFDRALSLQPQHAALHSNRGNSLKELGRLDEALQCYSTALAIEPNNAQTLHNRAVLLALLGRHVEALRDYEALAGLGQESALDLIGRAAALIGIGRFSEALALLDRAVALLPDEPDGHVQRGVALLNLERHPEAVDSFERALALRPDVPEVLNDLGVALTRAGRTNEALSSLIRSSALKSMNTDTLVNMGIVLKILGRHHEAARHFSKALARTPRHPAARFGFAFLHLALGEFSLGWPQYEARFEIHELGNPLRQFDFPRWDGTQPLAGQTLLVYAEQGLGDVIQFCRYVPLLVDRGASVVLEVMPSLKALLSSLTSTCRIIGRGEALPAADYYSPLMSLPLAFRTRLDTIPAGAPYLAADPVRTARWAERLQSLTGLRVGIAWQGNPALEKHIWARGRSVPLVSFEPLMRLPGISFVSLQKGRGIEQLRSVSFADRILDLSEDLDAGADAFLDTAAVMSSLDLVISSDTAIAHLAGALGHPVWTALTFSPEWRWLLDRADTPWYPRMRLFRQRTDGDWAAVVQAMATALQDLALTRAAKV